MGHGVCSFVACTTPLCAFPLCYYFIPANPPIANVVSQTTNILTLHKSVKSMRKGGSLFLCMRNILQVAFHVVRQCRGRGGRRFPISNRSSTTSLLKWQMTKWHTIMRAKDGSMGLKCPLMGLKDQTHSNATISDIQCQGQGQSFRKKENVKVLFKIS